MGNRVAPSVAIVTLAIACGRTDLLLSSATEGIDAAPVLADAAPADAPLREDSPPDATSEESVPSDSGMTAEVGAPDGGGATDDGSPGGCGPANCDSCCLPDGTCASFLSKLACGAGGQACMVCAPGEFCKGGCVGYQDNCGPSNCAGCCENSDLCATGNDDFACGHSGEECQRCVPDEGTGQCVPLAAGGGLCNGVQSCNPSSCNGCCEGNACLVGDTEDSCGSFGAACATCSAGQACASTPTGYACIAAPCDPSTCAGCCDGLVCALGDQDVACGKGGQACVSCAASGQKCAQSACH